MTQVSDYEGLRRALSDAGSVQEPAEIHGTLCGIACLGGGGAAEMLDEPVRQVLSNRLGQLNAALQAELQDPAMTFQPLLPDDEETPLETRVSALAHWCEGFLYGIGGAGGLNLEKLSEQVREIVRDFTELSKATVDEGEETAEADYAELVEYVRVGAQLIFLELNGHRGPGKGGDDRGRLH